jgi:prephenate dehydratase
VAHPQFKRVPAEDTAGSVREALASGDKTRAAIAGPRAAVRYGGVILQRSIQDNTENFTRFVLLLPKESVPDFRTPSAEPASTLMKMSLAMRLAHRPGALLESLQPFAQHGVNLLKIESRPIHGRPWEYQFFIDVESDGSERLNQALSDLNHAVHELRVLGVYQPARATLQAGYYSH